MGVDIYGLKPAITGEKPSYPDNFSELSNEERAAYYKKVDQWEEQNPGYYFRNNWWHWRPLQMLVGYFNKKYDIGIPEDEINSLGSNDGKGVSDPEHCVKLAEAFNSHASLVESAGYKTVSLNMGHWTFRAANERGNIVDCPLNDPTKLELLNEKYDTYFFGEAELDGVVYHTSHGTTTDNMRDFALFLQNCNGFAVH